jgi:hypothetical protein
MSKPQYDLNDFIEVCKNNVVIVTYKAQMTAREELKLNTKEDILQYIASFENEKFEYIKTTDSEQQPGNIIDVYSIKAKTPVYLAFQKNKIGKWIIKSFKKDDRYLPTDISFNGMPINKKLF